MSEDELSSELIFSGGGPQADPIVIRDCLPRWK